MRSFSSRLVVVGAILLIGAVAANAAVDGPLPRGGNDFRAATWGQSRQEVRKTEATAPILDDGPLLAFPAKVGGHPCQVIFLFSQNRLCMGFYQWSDIHEDLAAYFGDAAKLYGDFQDMPVDILGFDFTYSEDLISNIEMVGSSKVLALGLLDGRNTKMEDQEDVFRSFDRILTRVSVDHCYLTPSCGLEFLPRDRARRKLEFMTTLRFRYSKSGGR